MIDNSRLNVQLSSRAVNEVTPARQSPALPRNGQIRYQRPSIPTNQDSNDQVEVPGYPQAFFSQALVFLEQLLLARLFLKTRLRHLALECGLLHLN